MVKRKADRQGGRARKMRKVTVGRGVAPKNMVFPIKRTYEFQIQSNTTVNVVFGSRAFYLSDLPVSSDFINLFDQYRIVSVDMHCIPRANGNLTDAATRSSVFHYAKDFTDVTAPAAVTDLYQYSDCKRVNTQNIKDFHIKLKPQAAETYWSGLTASGYGAGREGTWINTSSPSVQHYGLKYAWTCNYPSFIDCYVTMNMEFKQPV